ncbi:hypothetical protein [Actinomadura rupiterrae]|uniref:hypothetical protein n=1 Tax=Actinomadura rupiterrae TaxID=559627 RepID=UPI0020A44805|nr:hypothetical protein [Actinomadura rupiterrae]MCP2343064.1 hypothetical protein [Actinomadura rupiterrae]
MTTPQGRPIATITVPTTQLAVRVGGTLFPEAGSGLFVASATPGLRKFLNAPHQRLTIVMTDGRPSCC